MGLSFFSAVIWHQKLSTRLFRHKESDAWFNLGLSPTGPCVCRVEKGLHEKSFVDICVYNRVSVWQVFGNAPPSTMHEKFSDLLQFTTQVSRLMVTEIRRRASNKSTGTLSYAHMCTRYALNREVYQKHVPVCIIVSWNNRLEECLHSLSQLFWMYPVLH